MGEPLVSVIIGTYNRASVIRETLAAVFAQTYGNVEVIVIDDNSTDGTLEYLRGLGDQIRLIERLENSGSADIPRYEAVQACKGDYVAFLDSDDLWAPAKLEKQVSAMQANPDWAMSHHYLRKILPDGGELEVRHDGKLPREIKIARPLLEHCFVSTSSVMVKPACWLEAQTREELGGFGTEWDFFLSIARKYPVGLVDEVLGSYRVVPDSVSHRSWQRGPWDVNAMERLKGKGLHEGICSNREMAKLIAGKARLNAVHYREENFPDRAFWFWRIAFRHTPFQFALGVELLKMIYRVVRPYPARRFR